MRILIVDDSPATRHSLELVLHDAGYSEVLLAASAEEALAILQPNEPGNTTIQLILLDVGLPGMSGLEACRRIKDTPCLHDIPVLMVTANTEDTALDAAFAAGANDYITKPVRPVELLARL